MIITYLTLVQVGSFMGLRSKLAKGQSMAWLYSMIKVHDLSIFNLFINIYLYTIFSPNSNAHTLFYRKFYIVLVILGPELEYEVQISYGML